MYLLYDGIDKFNIVKYVNLTYTEFLFPTEGRTCDSGSVRLDIPEAGLMGRCVEVEFIFSEFEWQVIQALDIDIIEIARKSIKKEIRDRAETRQFIYNQQNAIIKNENLRYELERLRRQLPTGDEHVFRVIRKKSPRQN